MWSHGKDRMPEHHLPFVRPATADDALAIAEAHFASWREAYSGLLPDEMLNGRSVSRRAIMWARILRGPGLAGTQVAESDGRLVGFGSAGRQRSPDLARMGLGAEIYALYVLSDAHRRGIGTALMRGLAAALVDRGHRGASLWVLRRNVPARRFYEALGGTVVAEAEDRRHHCTLVQVAYAWPDLGHLLP